MHFAVSKCRDVCEHILLWSYQADPNRLSSFWHGFYSPYLFSAHIQHTLMPLLITWTDSSTSSITLTLREILHWCNHISHCPLSRCFQSKHTRLQSPRERERERERPSGDVGILVDSIMWGSQCRQLRYYTYAVYGYGQRGSGGRTNQYLISQISHSWSP